MPDRNIHIEEEWLTPAEAARILRVHPRTVARIADDGKIHVIRPGAHRRYSAVDVAALVAQEPWEPAS